MDNRIKIHIVEDEALIAEEIRRTLNGLGYEVCGLNYDFDSAAAAIPASDADLFILDINLSGGSEKTGIELAGLLKSNNPKPFIFLSAYSDRDTISKATALHPANYLVKPVNPAALFAAIQLAIAKVQDPQYIQNNVDKVNPAFFYIKIGNRKEKLFWQDVYAMEASKNYVRIFINGQAVEYPLRGTISFVLDQLVPEQLREKFFRLGRSTCLNRNYITWVSEEYIICGDRKFQNDGRVSAAQFAAR